MTIRAYNSRPVYIWSTDGSSVFELSGVASPQTILIEDLNIAGCDTAIYVTASASATAAIDILDVTFGHNGVAFYADAEGGVIETSITDCSLADAVSYPGPVQPAGKKFQVGFRYAASDDGQNRRTSYVKGTLNGVTMSGQFNAADMDPVPLPGNSNLDAHDLKDGGVAVNEMTRIVEVYSVGDPASQEHETPQSWVTSPIPTVDLAITAGVLEGKAAVGAGWDAGVIAANEGTNNVLHDYVSAYNVSLVGTVVKDCRSVGVYGYCDSEARGKISMGGESRVGHTGSHTSHSAGQRFQSGAHLACHEGFLAFVASRTRFHLNNGNGITASTPNTSSPSFFPVGLHLDLQDCEIHENGTNGIAMDASWNNGTIPVFQPAIVGGTWDEFESTTIGLPIGPPSFWLNGDEPTAGQLPSQGMGIINRCAISNNGEYGIAVRARDPGSVVACRVSNNVIWNNSLGGLLALMDRDGEFNLYPKILMPLVHNSFVENGNSGAHRNVSFIGIPPQAQNGQFTHQESSGQGGMTLNTGIYNSLLYRGSGLQEDFGNDFLALFDWDDTFVFPQPSYQIAVAGIRARVGSLGPNPYHLSIDDTSFSFAGSINAATLAGWTPAPFFLGSVNSLVWHPGPSSVNLTLRVPNLFSIGVLHNDYSNDPRDGAFVDTWEKGADEL